MVSYKSPRELSVMREAGRVVAITLERVAAAAEPGVTPAELDAIAARCIKEHGARPSFLHYRPRFAPTPYPAVLCLSVNEVVVHGIPDGRRLRKGDLLSIDCGAEVGGYHGDAAITISIGPPDAGAARLMEATKRALERGIEAARPGARIGDISHAVEQVGREAGYGILEGCGGHGIGTAMHEEPSVPNTGRPGRGLRLREGLTIAIEPMFHEGGDDHGYTLADGWSIVTSDGSRAAHFEHTVAITADGPVVLTVP
ncbi:MULTISPECIES: type I methionyl aminopeptidase [Thermomonospora]|uniref:Methionine aminopeptidase n=1 Tax=Thermomonospora curvata (strain ATCC 19995 / DSM 43183 / JCM 3096 / KCTC 9072 / NBRC 15933 / NCIMB 10081 / Henssen B9) TaxID=471852 RepID=D1A429_THECD|nr:MULTISPECIES: type I methionyl aminopeptidase [Thermomonospora]ACY99903.1 methionine aminopeptidase, type I [Thermomonospora curvata DSM 43183]PKK12133.1 MAG: type I methionyl aminopeptidase [Thermomonospora sp. CIF 1]